MPTPPPPYTDAWLFTRIDAGLPPLSPDEAEARKPFEFVVAGIKDLELLEPPEGWEERAVARLAAARALEKTKRGRLGRSDETEPAARRFLLLAADTSTCLPHKLRTARPRRGRRHRRRWPL